MSLKKGNAEAARQNFSMHPDLVQTVMDTANALNKERTQDIIQDRGLRVTYSKVAAALVWHLQQSYLTPDGRITDALRHLMAQYEASDYEKTDAPNAEEVMEGRRWRASQFTQRPFPQAQKLELDFSAGALPTHQLLNSQANPTEDDREDDDED